MTVLFNIHKTEILNDDGDVIASVRYNPGHFDRPGGGAWQHFATKRIAPDQCSITSFHNSYDDAIGYLILWLSNR